MFFIFSAERFTQCVTLADVGGFFVTHYGCIRAALVVPSAHAARVNPSSLPVRMDYSAMLSEMSLRSTHCTDRLFVLLAPVKAPRNRRHNARSS